MLARVSGANDGIGDYLREGVKSGRFHSREQMDSREILHGDLELTESVIDSIEDKGQDRYLHITLSFKESDLTQETLEEITNEYVSNVMAAYEGDEFNYYAEAHRPKLQNIYNPSTDTMDERFLHAHIVIPKKNLVSNGRLNPTGRHLSNVKYIDAFQENINQKYGLESPSENKRDIIKGREEAIARYSGELMNSKSHSSSVKNKALEKTEGANYAEFADKLRQEGEVKIRNEGKPNEYLAIKFEGEKNFTNLREKAFSQNFLNNEPEAQPQKELDKTIKYWENIRSKEVKYIADASKNVRQEYKGIKSESDKAGYLNKRSEHFYSKHNYAAEPTGQSDGISNTRKTSNKPSHHNFGRRSARSRAPSHSLQELQKRTLVQHQGRTLRVLQGNADTHAHAEESGTDRNEGLRRPLHGGSGRRLAADSYMAQALSSATEASHPRTDAKQLNAVDPRKTIDYCAKHYLIDTTKVSPSTNKDGEPRIKVGNKNYSNTDYLTKELNLKWPEAREVLETLHHDKTKLSSEKSTITSEEVKTEWRNFTRNQTPHKNKERKELKKINDQFNRERSIIFSDFKSEKNQIRAARLSRQDRIYETAVSVRNKMARLEKVNEDKANTIAATRNTIKPFGSEVEDMKNVKEWEKQKEADAVNEKLRDNAFYAEAASIRGSKSATSFEETKRSIQNAAHNAEALSNTEAPQKLKISDLGVKKHKNGADFQDGNKTIFRDHGDFISTKRKPTDDSIDLTLQYAINRYGSNLEINGSDDFKKKIAESAAKNDLEVTFSDPQMNDALKNMKEEKSQAAQAEPQAAEQELNKEAQAEPVQEQEATQDAAGSEQQQESAFMEDMRNQRMTDDMRKREANATADDLPKIKEQHNAQLREAKEAEHNNQMRQGSLTDDMKRAEFEATDDELPELQEKHDAEIRAQEGQEATQDAGQAQEGQEGAQYKSGQDDSDMWANPVTARETAESAGTHLEKIPDEIKESPELLKKYITGVEITSETAVYNPEYNIDSVKAGNLINDAESRIEEINGGIARDSGQTQEGAQPQAAEQELNTDAQAETVPSSEENRKAAIEAERIKSERENAKENDFGIDF